MIEGLSVGNAIRDISLSGIGLIVVYKTLRDIVNNRRNGNGNGTAFNKAIAKADEKKRVENIVLDIKLIKAHCSRTEECLIVLSKSSAETSVHLNDIKSLLTTTGTQLQEILTKGK